MFLEYHSVRTSSCHIVSIVNSNHILKFMVVNNFVVLNGYPIQQAICTVAYVSIACPETMPCFVLQTQNGHECTLNL